MQKMQNFSGEGAQPPPRPLPSGEGDAPSPHLTPSVPSRLDLNPSHSEILPTILTQRDYYLVVSTLPNDCLLSEHFALDLGLHGTIYVNKQ